MRMDPSTRLSSLLHLFFFIQPSLPASALPRNNKHREAESRQLVVSDAAGGGSVIILTETFCLEQGTLNEVEADPLPLGAAAWSAMLQLCRELEHIQQDYIFPQIAEGEGSTRVRRFSPMIEQLVPTVIYPGTFWCGRGNLANATQSSIGILAALDICCRDHDHCADNLGFGECRYGICNFSPITLSHCNCDTQFRNCLLATGTDEHIANVGYIFFNLLRPKCFRFRRVIKGRIYEELDLMRESRADKDVIAEIAAEELEAYLDRSELVPDSIVKQSTIRTKLDHYIAQVLQNAAEFKADLGSYFCSYLNSEMGCLSLHNQNVFIFMAEQLNRMMEEQNRLAARISHMAFRLAHIIHSR